EDAGAKTGKVQPRYRRTFAAQPGRKYNVEILSTAFEPISVPRGAAAFPKDFAFTVSVSRQPEGWLGKIAAPAIIQTPTGPQRLVSFDIRLVPAGGNSAPRMEFATSSVLREGNWFRIEVTQTGVHKITREFLTNDLEINLDGVDPRDIALFGQPTTGKLPETNNTTPPDELTELAIAIEGEDDGSFDGGDFILFHALGPDRIQYNDAQDLFTYEKNIYATTNSYFLRIGGSRGRRVSDLPATSGGTEVTSYDAYFHFEEDKFNILHEIGGNAHGSGQSWFGDFFKNARQKEYPNLFQVPQLIASEPAELRARMALRTDASNRFFLEVEGQRLQSGLGSRIRIGAQEQSVAADPTTLAGEVSLTNGNVSVLVDYPVPANANTSEAYLDWIELRARRQLAFAGQEQFNFRDTRSRTAGTIRFNLADVTTDTRVWRVDGADTRAANLTDGAFSAPGGQLFEYVAFRTGAGLLVPTA
ncbi:MAG: hypothetical protein AAF840_16385, partial [Bacteroidota bacterium]